MKRRIAPGIWEDQEGNIHWSIAELLQMVELPDTPENRAEVTAMLKKQFAGQIDKVRLRSTKTQTFAMGGDGRSIICLRCNKTSYHPMDVQNKYCGHCHEFHTL